MAETLVSKRQREDTQLDDSEDHSKRHKSYNHILSLLEAEEDEPTQDLSSLITTLQQELSSSDSAFDPLPFPNTETDHEKPSPASSNIALEGYGSSSPSSSSSSSSGFLKEDGQEDDSERVMRHLLEASDDELGLPNRDEVEVGFDADDGFDGGNGFSLCDGLWELEDEAANYYTLVQSELFM